MHSPQISLIRFRNRLFRINQNSWPYTPVSFMDNLIRDIYFLNRISGVNLNCRQWTIDTIRNYEVNRLIGNGERFIQRFLELESELNAEYDSANYRNRDGSIANRIRDHYGALPYMNEVV